MTNAIDIVNYSFKDAKDTGVIHDMETKFRYSYLEIKAFYDFFLFITVT